MPKAAPKSAQPAKSRRNPLGQFQPRYGKQRERKPRTRKSSKKSAPAAEPTPLPQSPPQASSSEPALSPGLELTERERIFIEHILFHHEIAPLLEMRPGPHSVFRPWTKKECQALLDSPKIQQEITRRREQQELVNAQLAAKARELTPEFLKASLVNSIESSEGMAKVQGIDLGFAVAGIMTKGQLTVPAELPTAPNIYRALQTTTVQRVTETITQTKETSAPVPETPALPAPAIKAEPEILDY